MKPDFIRKYNSGTLGGLLLHLASAAAIVLLLCILYFYVYLPTSTHHGETITVPNVEGMAFDKVVSFLEEHDLRYEVSDSSYSSDYPPLTVLKQVPVSGSRVKENRKIYLSINRLTPPTVPMPDLIDGSLINADAVLRGSELKRGKIHLVSGPFLNVVKEMRINGKMIAPNTRIPKGTIIDLVVMDGGSKDLPTPNVIGMTLEDAKIPLLGSNLSIGKVELVGIQDTTGVKVVIIRQNPAPQENIRVGDIVDLWIGREGTELEDETTEDPADGTKEDQ
jgi:beta-lactam-binding protein with PASTA domain